MLAVEDVTCSRDVLGNKQKPLLDTLLSLLESARESKTVIDLVISTMKIGAQYILPQPEERVELLLSLLPKTSEELSKSTYGEVFILLYKYFLRYYMPYYRVTLNMPSKCSQRMIYNNLVIFIILLLLLLLFIFSNLILDIPANSSCEQFSRSQSYLRDLWFQFA